VCPIQDVIWVHEKLGTQAQRFIVVIRIDYVLNLIMKESDFFYFFANMTICDTWIFIRT
jgi:hypothetical protein